MAGRNTPKRKYDSTRRREQSARTRLEILTAARGLFERDGYVRTTMEAVADEAGVALKTVYLAFTTKSGLLRAVWDLALKGDTDQAPVADRQWYRTILEEPEPHRMLQLVSSNSVRVKRRIGPMLKAIRSAAEVDGDAADLWALIQSDFHANQGLIVATLATRTTLRPGLDPALATDILWTLNHPDVWLLLVDQRGWTPQRFQAWLTQALVSELLEN